MRALLSTRGGSKISTKKSTKTSTKRSTKRSTGRSAVAGLAAVTLALLLPNTAAAADPVRIITALRSTDEVQSDIKFLVADLAGERASYDELIRDFIDILLFGLETRQPARFDAMLVGDEPYRLAMALPLADLDEFIEENLEPVNINVRRRRRTRDTYDLRGNVYDGVMKVAEAGGRSVALLAREEIDLPPSSGPGSPGSVAASLLGGSDWDLLLHVGPESGTPEQRQAVAEAMKARRLDDIERRAEETPAQLALRKVVAGHSADRMVRLLGGAETIDLKTRLDQAARESTSRMVMVPRPGTELAENAARVGTIAYPYGRVARPGDAVFSLRTQYAMTDSRRARMRESLEAGRPVAQEQIDAAEATTEQKEARRKLTDLLYELLTDNTQAEAVNLFGDIRPAGGAHSGAMGATVADAGRVEELLDLVQQAYAGASVEKAVAEMTTADGQTVTLHRLTLPEIGQPLRTFFGTDTGLVGVAKTAEGDDHVFGAIGTEGEAMLTEALGKIEGPGETTTTIADVFMHAGPMMKLLDEVMSSNDASIIDFIRQRRQRRGTARNVQVGDPAAYRRLAITAMQQGDDIVKATLQRDGEQIVGGGRAGEAVLRALGEVVARMAEENLR